MTYRLRWHQRALVGCGVVLGLFFAVASLGALGYLVSATLDGTLLATAERSPVAIAAPLFMALFALCFAGVALAWSLGSLVDLLGAEVVLFGPVEVLAVHRGLRGRWFSAVVAGGKVELPPGIFESLGEGDRVWMRVGRLQRALKELAREDPPTPFRPLSRSQEPASATPAVPLPIAAAAQGATRAKSSDAAQGRIVDEALRRVDVPSPTAPWPEIERFALSYYGVTGSALSALHEHHLLARTLPETLTELRALLYFEQRRHRHFMRAPSGEALARVRAIIEAIRARVPPGA